MTQFLRFTLARWMSAFVFITGIVTAQAEVPVVQAPSVLKLEFGQPFEFTLKAANKPLGFSIKGLPFWLEREGDILRGTPVSQKEHVLTLFALNADGVSEPRKVKLQIVDATMSIPGTKTEIVVEPAKSEN